MYVQPYLNFDGRCEEAIEFYKKAIGAKVEMIMRGKDSPDKSMVAPGTEDKVMHAAFYVGDSLIMAADGYSKGESRFRGFSLSITAATEAEADRLFNALGEGGSIGMPQQETFFSPRFGMVTDKFGLGWMVIVPQQKG